MAPALQDRLLSSRSPVWMAPASPLANRASGAWVGCSPVSGLSMQSLVLTAGPHGLRELGPALLRGLRRPRPYAEYPGSRSDRCAIDAHRPRDREEPPRPAARRPRPQVRGRCRTRPRTADRSGSARARSPRRPARSPRRCQASNSVSSRVSCCDGTRIRHAPEGDPSRDWCGGEGGIRTPDALAGMPHFECGAFNRSATSPQGASMRPAVPSTRGAASQARRRPPAPDQTTTVIACAARVRPV